ncbi:MAG: hypothetical protein NTX50_06415 [Candidatus Sumerlaeota bacterium]|nr:hypothetical protein [Candidatus Sumerlaeota bacterium]
MPRILDEPVAESPLWLEIAGYPEYLSQKIRQGAWPVFKKLIETDAATNERPGVFTISLKAVAQGAGVEVKVAGRVIEGLRKEKMLRFYMPEHEEEEAMFQFLTPFSPPMDADQIRAKLRERSGHKPERLRYLDETATHGPIAENQVQQVVDAYLDTFGLRINSFVLDELSLLAGRFPVEAIRAAFSLIAQTQKPSLKDAMKYLAERKRSEK